MDGMTQPISRFQRIVAHPDGSVSYRPALGRRTRLRLAFVRRIDIACDWLSWRGHDRAAILIWRACGLWPTGREAHR